MFKGKEYKKYITMPTDDGPKQFFVTSEIKDPESTCHIATTRNWIDDDGVVHYLQDDISAHFFTGTTNKSTSFIVKPEFLNMEVPILCYENEVSTTELNKAREVWKDKGQIMIQLIGKAGGNQHVISLYIATEGWICDMIHNDTWKFKFGTATTAHVAATAIHTYITDSTNIKRHPPKFSNGLRCESISMAFYMAMCKNQGRYDACKIDEEIARVYGDQKIINQWREEMFFLLLNGKYDDNRLARKMPNLFVVSRLSIDTVEYFPLQFY